MTMILYLKTFFVCLFVWLGRVYFIHSYDIYLIARSYKTLSLGFQCLYLILPGMIKSREQSSGSSEQITKSKKKILDNIS